MSLSLRQRILWWSVANTLVVLLAAFLVVDTVFRNTILDDQRENVLAGTRLLQELQQSEVQQLQDLTASVAATPTLRAAVETRDPATIRQNLDPIVAARGVAWLAVTGPDGELLSATAGAPEDRIASADRLVAEARFYDTGDLWLRNGRLEQVFASSIVFGSTRLGVLFSGVAIGPVRVARLQAGTQQRVAFVAGDALAAGGSGLDERGVADFLQEWSRPVDDLTGAPAPAAVAAAPGDSVRDGVREFTAGGARFLGAAIALPDQTGVTAARLVTFRSLDEAMQPATALRFALLGIAMAGILLAFAASLVLSQRVTRPVNRLLQETVRLGSGELNRPIEAERNDEIGALARGFDHMRVSLGSARADLVRAERLSAVGRAASAIVHDFKQPVTAIQFCVDMLENGDDDEAQRREDLGTIRTSVSRLIGMMGEILDFARGGEAAVQMSPGSVPDLLEEVAAAARAALPGRNGAVAVQHGYDGDWSLDLPKTRRALENLALNAAAAAPRDGWVRLESHRAPAGLRLVVADNGPGIPTGIQDTLFEAFVTHGKKDGTGLGLAIVKAFIERQGGTVHFETSDQGTRFILEFPNGAPA